ncbi:DUF2842 domain-containing protein [Pinisolibacter aquiterrae]|jgi:hypothetical protein|uniref:DUF2842 domain-containing protein n=1 Tax=Pinisolibacter aquiterrae TaxID=2815579 RepID=UPI001C3E046F|nr:DUF2842 domain-containing protein [Pinisolibacter aquiterrae]MBV5264112.1 DUF2842 domain-containing protein [Pinisolibacter aquiterrae]MCC8233793.1 DUF2842 domain-containing protein [Pinisolibacter aquiterrae]
MTSPARRFAGSLILVIFLLVYVFFATAVGDVVVASKSGWVQFAYFVVAGLAWVPVAGLIVRWMYRPIGRPKA